MKASRSTFERLAAAGLVLLALAGPARADDPPNVSVALIPSGQTVVPGAEFDLEIDVTQAGLLFNGFGAVVSYDPAALTLLPTSPLSLQEGSFMTGACGNTFHSFRQGASTDTISEILLCAGVSLTGPGQLYRLHFRASITPQQTLVQFLTLPKFYNEGLYVNPVVATNAMVGIGMPATGVGDPGPAGAPSLRIAPNPGRGAMLFMARCDRGGPETLSVFDAHGRVVRRFTNNRSGPAAYTIAWDGRDQAGGKLPPGLYFATLTVAGRSVSSRFTLID